MHVALLVIALQLDAPALTRVPSMSMARRHDDSVRVIAHAHDVQAAFERHRRFALPTGHGSGGRCDVRLGRFCWWYDGGTEVIPPERESIGHQRAELLTELDASAARYPGDDWLAGMRVHYRVDARTPAAADSVAQQCRATPWWCAALVGYAAHERGDAMRADSAFTVAVASMPPDSACAWNSIAPLLAGDDRDAYERRPCDTRAPLEARFWLVSRPQLSTSANEWKNEFNARRVINWLAARSVTPHLIPWGDDAAELVLRYGWPVGWSKMESSVYGVSQSGIIGHDPSPSFMFTPHGWLSDSSRSAPPSAWELDERAGESRFAPRLVRRVAPAAAQLARFRRGDSTLVVAAYAAFDDSLRAPSATLGAATLTSDPAVASPDSGHAGVARVMLAGPPFLAGIDIIDTTTHTLARMRTTFAASSDSSRVSLSDLLLFRGSEAMATSLDSALARAIPGDTVTRNRPLGLFWETYGLVADGESVDVAVSVERVDHSWIRSTRQRLGLAPVDTPIRMRWTDARPPANRAATNAILLDLANLDGGRYRMSLVLTPVGGSPVSTTREVELIDP